MGCVSSKEASDAEDNNVVSEDGRNVVNAYDKVFQITARHSGVATRRKIVDFAMLSLYNVIPLQVTNKDDYGDRGLVWSGAFQDESTRQTFLEKAYRVIQGPQKRDIKLWEVSLVFPKEGTGIRAGLKAQDRNFKVRSIWSKPAGTQQEAFYDLVDFIEQIFEKLEGRPTVSGSNSKTLRSRQEETPDEHAWISSADFDDRDNEAPSWTNVHCQVQVEQKKRPSRYHPDLSRNRAVHSSRSQDQMRLSDQHGHRSSMKRHSSADLLSHGPRSAVKRHSSMGLLSPTQAESCFPHHVMPSESTDPLIRLVAISQSSLCKNNQDQPERTPVHHKASTDVPRSSRTQSQPSDDGHKLYYTKVGDGPPLPRNQPRDQQSSPQLFQGPDGLNDHMVMQDSVSRSKKRCPEMTWEERMRLPPHPDYYHEEGYSLCRNGGLPVTNGARHGRSSHRSATPGPSYPAPALRRTSANIGGATRGLATGFATPSPRNSTASMQAVRNRGFSSSMTPSPGDSVPQLTSNPTTTAASQSPPDTPPNTTAIAFPSSAFEESVFGSTSQVPSPLKRTLRRVEGPRGQPMARVPSMRSVRSPKKFETFDLGQAHRRLRLMNETDVPLRRPTARVAPMQSVQTSPASGILDRSAI